MTGAALPDTATFSEDGVRLQKVLARAGVGSRRVCEQMIDQGRIEVNGQRVKVQGMRIDPATAVVKVDGMRVMITEDLVHLALNKPRGWQSTMQDEMNRPCVGDLVAERIAAGQRLFHVGRLDAETEGLLLLTNDGELAHRLMHPSYKVRKTYLANVEGMMSRATEREMRAGVELEDGPVEIDEITTVDMNEGSSLVKIVLHEGRKHIVRRLLEHVGHPVTELVRTQIGTVQLGEQRPGTMRVLNRQEVGNLYKEVGL
ncbi:pseudouridine synthase [Lolliginicoccus suaedae]|uniref:pseudouridine synthase n=1 Tax=Lolliginicoccus suaedae TaxID=2605429 RepID=UPI002E261F77